MKFICWSIIQISNIIWKYKNTTSVNADTSITTVVYDDIWRNIELLPVIVIFGIKKFIRVKYIYIYIIRAISIILVL